MKTQKLLWEGAVIMISLTIPFVSGMAVGCNKQCRATMQNKWICSSLEVWTPLGEITVSLDPFQFQPKGHSHISSNIAHLASA